MHSVLEEREVDWRKDSEALRGLYGTTWKGHPILNERYFDWQFLENPAGKAIGYCAVPTESRSFCAGIYAVIPITVLVQGQRQEFSTSLYTMTHPGYYRRGIFGRLAKETYKKCSEMGILGTIGVPNNSSLPGFVGVLGFKAIGQFQVIGRPAQFPRSFKEVAYIKYLSSERDLSDLKFDLDLLKAKSGVVLAERSKDFITWRFFRCPGFKYHLFVALDHSKSVKGMIVVRCTTKRKVPVTVLVDFLLDHTLPEADAICRDLLSQAYRLAWRHLSPIVITLVNPFSHEGQLLFHNGFKRLPRAILPHDSSFILKLYINMSDHLTSDLQRFENWYFSFADYDIF